MTDMEPSRNQETRTTTTLLIVLLALLGLLFIAISLHLPEGYYKELLKELGIVVLAVFTVSLLYELLIAKKYLSQFLALLRKEVEKGESNAAACARLGILEIFPTRDVFEMKHPIANWTSTLVVGSSLRIVGQSLLLLMNKPATVKMAIEQGAQVDLCLTDPGGPVEQAGRISGLEVSDISSAVAVFKREIAEWVKTGKPSGSVELRYHQIPLFDSCLQLNSRSLRFVVWDLSFGRDLTAKRTLLLDPTKPLGADLSARYDKVWKDSATVPVFKYQAGIVSVDEL